MQRWEPDHFVLTSVPIPVKVLSEMTNKDECDNYQLEINTAIIADEAIARAMSLSEN